MSGRESETEELEVEWQFEVRDLAVVRKWLECPEGVGWTRPVRLTRTGGVEISDTYLDTKGLRVLGAGYALRVRRTGDDSETTMKSVASSGDGRDALKSRREVSETGVSLSGDGSVSRRVKALAGRHKPSPLFEVATSRRTFSVHFEDSGEEGPFAEVALDETEILTSGGEPVALRRVEVEVERGSSGDFEPFVEGLRRGCGLSPAGSSKFEAGLAAAGIARPETPDLGSKEVTPDLTLGEVAYAVLREQFERFLAHEMGTRLGEDPEELHDIRVAGRRSRAALSVFAEALPKRGEEFRREIERLSRLFGEVRDFDVQLEDMERWRPVETESVESLAELRVALEKGREHARRAMLQALDSRRYRDFVEEYRAFLKRGLSRRTESGLPVLEAAPGLLRRYYRRFRKVGDSLSESSTNEKYHKLRKRGKRLRYALESLYGVYGEPAREEVRALKELQDVLGEHQDAVVAAARLRKLAESGTLSRRTVFFMGGVARDYEARAEQLRRLSPKAYSKTTGRRWKKLKKRSTEVALQGGSQGGEE